MFGLVIALRSTSSLPGMSSCKRTYLVLDVYKTTRQTRSAASVPYFVNREPSPCS
jgi:hypothetical protein